MATSLLHLRGHDLVGSCNQSQSSPLIVASFEDKRFDKLWQVILLAIGGNLFLLLGLAGKRYGYARLATGFRRGLTLRLFKQFAAGHGLPVPFRENSRAAQPVSQTIFSLSLKQVSFNHEGRQILDDLSCQIEAGQKVAVIGPSGSGKSTLFNLIYGNLFPDQGQILFYGQSLNTEELLQHLAYLKQDSHCFDCLTVEENLSLGQPIDEMRMTDLLETLKLGHLRGRELGQANLSGGERQRLDFASSLYHQKELILADEIKANLDQETASIITDLLLSRPETLIEVIHHYAADDLAKYDQVIRR